MTEQLRQLSGPHRQTLTCRRPTCHLQTPLIDHAAQPHLPALPSRQSDVAHAPSIPDSRAGYKQPPPSASSVRSGSKRTVTIANK